MPGTAMALAGARPRQPRPAPQARHPSPNV